MSKSNELNFAKTTVKGTFWTYASHYGGKLLVFVSTTILARLLTQEDFGIVGFALVVISFLYVLNDLGIGSALIYYADDPDAPHTGFWLGLLMGIVLFGITWLIAPLAGTFFHDARAVPVTRALGSTFPIIALGNVHESLLHKNLAFRRKFIPDVTKMTSKGLTSIILALLGFSFWSMVAGQIVGAVVLVIAYWYTLPFRPQFRFNQKLVRPLLSYGSGIVAVNAIAILLTNADYLFVGRFLGAAALGVYTLAFRIPDMLIIQFCTVVGKVLFPVYAKMRDNKRSLQNAFLMTMRYVSLVTVPLGLGMALVAEPFVLTFFTDKWAEAIPVMRAISIYALFFSLAYNAGSVYKAEGRPMLLTKLALIRAAMLMPALWWAASGPGTITAVGWTHAAVALVAGTLNLVVAGRILQTPFSKIVATLRPAVTGGIIMSLGVTAVLAATASLIPLLQLILAVAVGGGLYLGFLWISEHELRLQATQTWQQLLARRSA
ncbi:MAG: lipopolysaccharide biosynthesis protein [Anaerolineales bacterium]|nr:lipopolysaccharide biosynthesis protein [Anaerolineales bacterium]MCA9929102.1 lipopolysaccharide biosynthesis protein [Anaerolineales bacterium]